MKRMNHCIYGFLGLLMSVSWSPEESGITLSNPEALKHHGTVVQATYDATPISGDRNFLWCATFQMAWDQACRKYDGPLRVSPKCALADSLNRNPFQLEWIDAGSIALESGALDPAMLERIERGTKQSFGRPSAVARALQKTSAPGDLVFYARLKKDLQFPKPFGKLGNWPVGDHKVPWFGFTPEQKDTEPLRRQVLVHHYGNKSDFVIELATKETDDQLILAKLPDTPANLEVMKNRLISRLISKAPGCSGSDLLAVPNVVADESVTFSELHGKIVAGTGGRFIRSTMQTIDFRMDEAGVRLRSEASLSLGCSVNPHIEPRLLILDPPFAVLMKRKSAPQPYFLAWFGNADLLRGK